MAPAPHSQYKELKVHTARCDECDGHNKATAYRCSKCFRQYCTPCFQKDGGDSLHILAGGHASGKEPIIQPADPPTKKGSKTKTKTATDKVKKTRKPHRKTKVKKENADSDTANELSPAPDLSQSETSEEKKEETSPKPSRTWMDTVMGTEDTSDDMQAQSTQANSVVNEAQKGEEESGFHRRIASTSTVTSAGFTAINKPDVSDNASKRATRSALKRKSEVHDDDDNGDHLQEGSPSGDIVQKLPTKKRHRTRSRLEVSEAAVTMTINSTVLSHSTEKGKKTGSKRKSEEENDNDPKHQPLDKVDPPELTSRKRRRTKSQAKSSETTASPPTTPNATIVEGETQNDGSIHENNEVFQKTEPEIDCDADDTLQKKEQDLKEHYAKILVDMSLKAFSDESCTPSPVSDNTREYGDAADETRTEFSSKSVRFLTQNGEHDLQNPANIRVIQSEDDTEDEGPE